MKLTTLCLLISTTLFSSAVALPQPKAPWVKRPGHYPGASKGQVKRAYTGTNTSTCPVDEKILIKAPKKNIFMGLEDSEAAAVTAFLHKQASLNLTAVENATR